MTGNIPKSEPLIHEHDGDVVVPDSPDSAGWEANGPFDHTTSQAGDTARPKDTKIEGFEVIVDDQPKRKIRQQGLYADHGFYASTKEELVRATGLNGSDFADKPYNAAKYVANVVLHQKKIVPKVEDPNAAGRAVTSEIIDFATRARGDRAALEHLETVVANSGVARGDSLADVSDLKDWRLDNLTARAIIDLKRFTQMQDFADGEGEDPFEMSYSPQDKDDVKALQAFMEGLSVGQAINFIHIADARHQNQLNYWVEKIKQIEAFSTGKIRGIASGALGNMGVKRPE